MATTLDLSGLHCPQVVLRLAAFARTQPAGTLITVISTDPLSAVDIPYYLDRAGHHLVTRTRDATGIRFVIACGASPGPRETEAG